MDFLNMVQEVEIPGKTNITQLTFVFFLFHFLQINFFDYLLNLNISYFNSKKQLRNILYFNSKKIVSLVGNYKIHHFAI